MKAILASYASKNPKKITLWSQMIAIVALGVTAILATVRTLRKLA